MNTSIATESALSTESKKHSATVYFGWALVLNFLFYNEYWGLNALIACIASISLFSFIKPTLNRNTHWWVASLIWLLTAIGVFITGSVVSSIAYLVGFVYFSAVSNHNRYSIPLGLVQSFFSFIIGCGNYFQDMTQFFQGSSSRKNKWLLNTLLIGIPVIIALIFLKLYQAADASFYELTKFINLDWISWGFVFTLLLLTIFLYGFFFPTQTPDIHSLEKSLKNDIPTTYEDQIQQFFGLLNEKKIAASILITLNLLLLLYNLLDVKFLFIDLHSPLRDGSLSEVVHQGVYSLIFSIVLVILVVAYLFRGQLNFERSKTISLLAIFWLIQNLFMVLTTGIKNMEYVSSWGLTYKRIGVFVYLFLAAIGLTLTVYKILRKRSFWFLVRSTTLAFSLCLSALLTFNWNRTIASYNTRYLAYDQVDFDYLMDLGADTYPYILHFHHQKQAVPNGILFEISQQLPMKIESLGYKRAITSWLSTNWSDWQLERELTAIQFQYR